MDKERLMDEFYSTFEENGKAPGRKKKREFEPEYQFKTPLDPSDQALEIAASWLNNTSTQEELERMELFLKNSKKKLEVFAIQKALTQASKYANMFSQFHRQILPLITGEDALAAMTPREQISVAQLMYSILEKEGEALNLFLQKGPSEVPPIANSRVSILKSSEENQPALDAVEKFEALPPSSRDKLRLLLSGLEKVAKQKKSNDESDPK